MSKSLKAEIALQQSIRRRLLANGFSPLANKHKVCVLKGWPELQIDDTLIDTWEHALAWRGTGLRLDHNLIAIDVDVDDAEMVNHIFAAMREVAPAIADALVRYGRGSKECWVVRIPADAEPVSRIASTAHVKPGQDPTMADAPLEAHRVEILGSSGHQIGAFGAHSLNPDGSHAVTYRWMETNSPLDVPFDEVPILTREELRACYIAANGVFAVHGWPRILKIKDGECKPTTLYDLTDDMVFHCNDGGTRNIHELHGFAARDSGSRCSASWLEGPTAINRERCLVGLDRDNVVYIFETGNHVTHKPAAARPIDDATRAERLAERLLERGFDLKELHPEAPAPFEKAVLELHADYAFCAPRQRPCLPLYRDEELSTTVANLRLQYAAASYEKTGPKGGTKRVNPVDVWINSPLRLDADGYRFLPDQPRGMVEIEGQPLINSYAPPQHGEPAPGAVEVFLAFLAHLVPDDDPREWLMDRIAHKVQNPLNPGVGVLFYSPVHGTGRGTLFDMLRGVFGDRNCSNISASQLLGGQSQGQYNDWQQAKVMGFVEEVLQSGDDAASMGWRRRKDYEKLKEHLEPRARMAHVNRKGLPNVDDLICIWMMMATNHDNALPVDPADRRLVVIRGTDEKLSGSDTEALLAPFRTGKGFTAGFCAAVYAWAMDREVSGFDVFTAPDWGGKASMVEANETEFDELATEILNDWPLDWAERGAFIDRFAYLADRRKLALYSGNIRNVAGDLLKRRWPMTERIYLDRRTKKTAFFRTTAERMRVSAMSFAERQSELNLQSQLDSRAPASVLAQRLGINVVDPS